MTYQYTNRKYEIGDIYEHETRGEIEILSRDKWDMTCSVNGVETKKSIGAHCIYIKKYGFKLKQ